VASVGIVPALGILVGAAFACLSDLTLEPAKWVMPLLAAASVFAWRSRAARVTSAIVAAAFAAGGAALASDARAHALHPSLRTLLDAMRTYYDPKRRLERLLAVKQLVSDKAAKTAIQALANMRAQIGANIQRLNLTSEQLTVLNENLTAANSRIKDVDVADESTQFAKLNILVQSGTAMLAQANLLPQSALRLLG